MTKEIMEQLEKEYEYKQTELRKLRNQIDTLKFKEKMPELQIQLLIPFSFRNGNITSNLHEST